MQIRHLCAIFDNDQDMAERHACLRIVENAVQGQFDGAIYGHGGSVNEPYATLRLYQGASIAVPGAHQANFARWKNTEYDKLVDEAYGVAPDDTKKLAEIWRRAMEIWLPELPDIQLVQNIHRIPRFGAAVQHRQRGDYGFRARRCAAPRNDG